MSKARHRTLRRELARLRAHRGGSVSIEYLVVTTIGLTVVAALGVLGAGMVDAYSTTLQILYSDSP